MAIPLIPIILAVSALGSGIVQGISSMKNARAEEKALKEATVAQVNERAKQAKKLMQEQKTSFLKGGVYFDSGSPVDIINETYDTYKQDIGDMIKDTETKSKNLIRQGRTAFYSSLLEGVANAGMSYFMGTKGLTALKGGSSTTTAGSFASKLSNVWQNVTGKYRGGFMNVLPTKNGLPSTNTTRIV